MCLKIFFFLMWHNIWARKRDTNIFKLAFQDPATLFGYNFPPFLFPLLHPHPTRRGWWKDFIMALGGLGCIRRAGTGGNGGSTDPDPVLSINLNPDLPGPQAAHSLSIPHLIALKMTLHLKVPLCKHPTGTDSYLNYYTALNFHKCKRSLSLWWDSENNLNCCAKQYTSLFGFAM